MTGLHYSGGTRRALSDLGFEASAGLIVSKPGRGDRRASSGEAVRVRILEIRHLPEPMGIIQSIDSKPVRVPRGRRFRAACLERGDIVLVAKGGSPRVAVVDPISGNWVAAGNLMRLRARDPVVPAEVVALWLATSAGQRALRRRSRSSTGLIALSARAVEDLEVPVPATAGEAALLAELFRASAVAHAQGLEAAARRLDLALRVAETHLATADVAGDA